MYISDIYVENFLSYKKQYYKFEIGKPILIQGANKNKSGQESNGSGKSGLQSALEYLLLKSTSRKGRDVDLIRRGQDNGAIVRCKIVCPTRKQVLTIKRTIPQKGSTTIEISINDDPQEIANVDDGNKYILMWLNYTSEDLQNYYLINKERYTSFFYSSNTKKLDLIARFANIKIIDGVDDLVGEDVSIIEDSISKLEKDLLALESKVEECNEQLIEESNRNLEKERQDKINEIESSIVDIDTKNKNLSLGIEHLENNIHDSKKKYTEIKGDIDKMIETINKTKSINYKPKINEINASIEESDKYVRETNIIKQDFLDGIESLDKDLRKLSVSISGSVKCPKCSHEFVPNSEVDIEKVKKDIEVKKEQRISINTNVLETEELIDELKTSIRALNSELQIYKSKQKEEEVKICSLKEELSSLEENLSNKQSNINSLQNDLKKDFDIIESNNNKIELLFQEIETIKGTKLYNPRIKELKDKIKSYSKEIEEKKSDISTKHDEAFKIRQWIFNFKKFRSKLAQESLSVIQNKVNEQLKLMKSDIRLKLGGFKMRADGNLKEEITPTIIDNGDEVTFGSLSGGERVRVDFATILALQDIINQTHPYGGLDVLWTDEIGEGIDPLGLKLLMKSMPEGKTVLVTTHVTIKDVYDNVLMVENNNGISSII